MGSRAAGSPTKSSCGRACAWSSWSRSTSTTSPATGSATARSSCAGARTRSRRSAGSQLRGSVRRALAALAVVASLALLAALAVRAPATAHAQAYEIPPDNLFVGGPGARPEIYVYGMRNPYRWSSTA